MNRFSLSLFLVFVTIGLVAQTPFTVYKGKTGTYDLSVNGDSSIYSYNWKIYSDEGLTLEALSSEAEVGTITKNQVDVDWNELGTYYLAVSVTGADGCYNKMAFPFNVVDCNGLTSVSGYVYNQTSGTSIKNVPLTLIPQGTTTGDVQLRITDASGYYEFDSVSPGDYLVQVQDANLNAAKGLYPYGETSSLFFTTLEACEPQTHNYYYAPSDLPVLGDFVWYDLNRNGIQDEWYDANNDGKITQNIPVNGVVDYDEWEWIDYNEDGSYYGSENEGELNKAGIGNALSSNIIVSGPNGYSEEVIIGYCGYWRDRPGDGVNSYGDYSVYLNLDNYLKDAVEDMAATNLVKVDSNWKATKSAFITKSATVVLNDNTEVSYTQNNTINVTLSVLNHTQLDVDFGVIENTKPIPVNDSIETIQTDVIAVLSGDSILLNNDTDADADDLSVILVNNRSSKSITGIYGTLNWDVDGTYTYTPNTQMDTLSLADTVQEIFTYTVTDGIDSSRTAKLVIDIIGENNAPILADDINSTIQSAVIDETDGSGTLLNNDTDPDGDKLTVISLGGYTVNTVTGTYGVIAWNTDGTYTYTPNAAMDTLGSSDKVVETFSYTAEDENGATASAKLIITISGSNQAPVLVADTCTVIESTPTTENLLTNDTDGNGDALKVTEIGGNTTGTLTGTYGTLIWNENGNYTYIPNAGFDTLSVGEILTETFPYTVSDGTTTSSSTITVNITGENDSPVLADDSNTTTKTFVLTTDSSNGLLSNDNDIDGDHLTVTLVNGNTSHTITGTYGTLEWNSDGSYTYTPNVGMDTLIAGESVFDDFTYTVSDGTSTSSATLTVTVSGSNSNPIAVNDNNSTIETAIIKVETTTGKNLLANDIDPEGNTLTVANVDGDVSGVIIGTYGTLAWSSDGTYIYTPNSEMSNLVYGQSVYETFDVTITDGNGGTDTSVLTITISGKDANTAPYTNPDYIVVTEDTTNVYILPLENDRDPDADDFYLSSVTTSFMWGAVSLNGDTVIYTPASNFYGEDYIVYQICDMGSPILCSTDTIFVTVTPVNDAPVANPDSALFIVGNNPDITIDVLENDEDVDGDLTVSIVDGPISGGTVTVVDNNIVYYPSDDFTGEDYFIYSICDDGTPQLCAQDTVFVKVVESTIAIDDLIEVGTGETVTINVLDNDIFYSAVDIEMVSEPTHGSYYLQEDGTLTYTAPSNDIPYSHSDNSSLGDDDTIYTESPALVVSCRIDTLTYVIENEYGVGLAYIIVDVIPIITLDANTFCLINEAYYSWNADVIGININTIDITVYDAATNSVLKTMNNAQLSGEASWSEFPESVNSIILEVTYTVCEKVKIEQVEITRPDCSDSDANRVNAITDYADAYSGGTTIDVLANDYDDDQGDIDPSSVLIYTQPEHGTVTVYGNGTIRYIPEYGYEGDDSFVYRVCDDYEQTACDTAFVWLNVDFNEDIVAVDDYYNIYTKQTVILDIANNDYDPDGEIDSTSIQVLTRPTNGSYTINDDGTVTYRPIAGFEGVDKFQYSICDNGTPQTCDTAWVYITVAENVCLVLENDTVSTTVNKQTIIDVMANDSDYENDIDSTSFVISDNPENGTATINRDYTITYVPNDFFVGVDSFAYTLCDNGNCCETVTVYVTIVDDNEAIVAVPDNVISEGGYVTTFNPISNDYDPDGEIDITSVTIFENPLNGVVTIDSVTGEFTYTPNAHYAGVDSFIYQVCDNGIIVSCDTAMVYVTVTENLVPIAIDDTITAVYGVAGTDTITNNDYDPEGELDYTSVTIIDNPVNGAVVVDSTTGIITYMPDMCSANIDSFTYVISDLQGNISDTATVIVNITISPEMDSDNDGVFDIVEDLDGDGNPCNDDTDGDLIPNFLDDDDDGDGILTSDEDLDYDGNATNDDTDGDGIPNYIDDNDDNDCFLTANEDLNGDGNLFNDDTDGDGIPNYLDDDDDGDGLSTCDESGDLDGNGIPDYLETWYSVAVDDDIDAALDEDVVINVLVNDSTTFNDSTIIIIDNPANGSVVINTDDWTISYVANWNFIGVDSFTYVVCDYYNYVCDTAVVRITVEDVISAPQLFTPNNDGDNDTYVISGLERYTDCYFEVFNRWGRVVYTSNDYQNDWDGYANVKYVIGDNQLPDGVYYFILRYGNNREKIGEFYLRR